MKRTIKPFQLILNHLKRLYPIGEELNVRKKNVKDKKMKEGVKIEFPTEESVDKKTRVILPEYHVTWACNNVKSITSHISEYQSQLTSREMFSFLRQISGKL